jgi:hypothetical protein
MRLPLHCPRDGGRRVNDAPAEREGISWWDALRRRKVVQWTVAYAAGAWVLLQVLDFAADAFAWPPITKPLAMLGAAIGLSVVATLTNSRFLATEARW